MEQNKANLETLKGKLMLYVNQYPALKVISCINHFGPLIAGLASFKDYSNYFKEVLKKLWIIKHKLPIKGRISRLALSVSTLKMGSKGFSL